MNRIAPAYWQSRGLPAILLLPVAGLFGVIAALRKTLYQAGLLKTISIPVPVIVVGNIAVGGSGKTPVVLWLAEQLRMAGFKPGIISRGYGGRLRDPVQVPLQGEAAEYGDEALLLAQCAACPVVTGRDRPAAAMHLLTVAPTCDIIISDDGMQHYRLRRDVEIAVVDECVMGNGWLLPAGSLREPVRRLLDVDLVLAHGALSEVLKTRLCGRPVSQMRLEGHSFRSVSMPEIICSVDDFRGKRIHAIAGIGRPERFFTQLTTMGLDVEAHAFPDHHAFTAADLDFAPGEPKIMTTKDAVKCRMFASAECWEFPVTAHIGADAMPRILEKLKHGYPPA